MLSVREAWHVLILVQQHVWNRRHNGELDDNRDVEVEKAQLECVQNQRERDIMLSRDGDDLVILAEAGRLGVIRFWWGLIQTNLTWRKSLCWIASRGTSRRWPVCHSLTVEHNPRHAKVVIEVLNSTSVKRTLNEGCKWRRLGDARSLRMMWMRSTISRWVNSTPAARRWKRGVDGICWEDRIWSDGSSCSDYGAARNDDASSHRKIKRRVSDLARYDNSFSMTRMTKDHGCDEGGLQQKCHQREVTSPIIVGTRIEVDLIMKVLHVKKKSKAREERRVSRGARLIRWVSRQRLMTWVAWTRRDSGNQDIRSEEWKTMKGKESWQAKRWT